MPLSTDDLCNEIKGQHRALHHWQNTRSPFIYWTRDIIHKVASLRLCILLYSYET